MKSVFYLLMLSVILAGCATTVSYYDPRPANPEYTISVSIDSIPTGANVYAIANDGQLGKIIGTTPFVHEIGLAGHYTSTYSNGERTKRELNDFMAHLWGEGIHDEGHYDPSSIGTYTIYSLEIALVKDNHSIGVAKKEIYSSWWKPKSSSLSLTVPLKTIEQVNFERQLAVQKQAQSAQRNSQQNITVQHQKDDIDTINGALDALIKLNGLGAFR